MSIAFSAALSPSSSRRSSSYGSTSRPRPSYDRALWALRFWLDSWRGIRRRRARYGAPGVRSPAHAVRRARLAGDLLHDRDGALDHERDRLSVGTDAVASRPGRGVR